jgi:hypothetical protein
MLMSKIFFSKNYFDTFPDKKTFWKVSAIMIVKIMSWLVKSYDFTSQYIFNMRNRFKNLKMIEIKLKLSEINKIK